MDILKKEIWGNMRYIKSNDITHKIYVQSQLYRDRYCFQLHVKTFSDTPDIVLSKCKKVVSFNGYFWYRHKGYAEAIIALTNQVFLEKKDKQKVERVKRKQMEIKHAGKLLLGNEIREKHR
ncbi:MAG: very short patch repair endonuclease [Lentisphaeria bacterium]|nr:very short patch repair endonuclease [Lentisphaeria bacterium]